ncbi:MAG: hypothetical protein ABWX96_22195 [Propionibacteriaceae bacterium]
MTRAGSDPRERWSLVADGRSHLVEIIDAGFSRRVVWLVDGEQVASRKAGEERLRITPDDDGQGLGALALRFPSLVGPTRRVTWYGGSGDLDAAAEAAIGLGGLDFEPEPGSAPARREARIREHPRRYAATQTAAGVAKVVVPLVLIFLLSKLALSVDWPDLPRIPWPDLPQIPWPDIAWPSIPWPNIPWPDWSLPALPEWVREVLDKLKYVWPVIVAFVLARAEVDRRRKQDALKAQRSAVGEATETDQGSPAERRTASGEAASVPGRESKPGDG